MYVCGPTVYDDIHIGNARPVIFFDVVRRYFESKNYQVDYVSNITDVDDKIINKAQELGVSELEIAKQYYQHYQQVCQALNIKKLQSTPKVTENMPQIINFINTLIEKGVAYEVAGDVYFKIKKVAEYGKLSGKKIADLIAGVRVETNVQKADPLDFTLWKKTNTGITWDSPWGAGRPGWHTECVVMIEEAFNGKIDFHGGGADLQFPHHENEIAQSIVAFNHPIANNWLHVGHLSLDGEKMSKSLGNSIYVKDLLALYDANVFRLAILSTHYRQPINFSMESLQTTQKEWHKVQQAYNSLAIALDLNDAFDANPLATKSPDQLEANKPEIAELAEFDVAMADDFNTANAISAMYKLVKHANKLHRQKADNASMMQALFALQSMLEILGFVHQQQKLTPADKKLYQTWEQARLAQDFALADECRTRLQAKGLI